jgi:hypothetical protein
MTFAEQMVKDARYITHAEMSETITYAGNSIEAVVDAGKVEVDEMDGGDEEGTVTEYDIEITDNSDAVNYPGVATPAYDDAVTVRGDSGTVVGIEPKDINGLWHLRVRIPKPIRIGPSNTNKRN